ncbi:MAG: hypothetical protein DKM50_05155 [Candidatus Margulisiibacteriota bacterium]|nr:MAG: hypothetical protein A2X42_03470 [Candidatus Margulisbacteria bacterium GWF2_38_17]OGI06554.1 MAG: hypothetical protein A2X41_00410 [Candidatus Margulisbacteria bacterium GWE2_39_32]PZM81924.1 MAG: hypothetical protein DKM50_05155 [Candidatus Margulisiibacteriota bacterium]HCT85278.1 hypothetical protein [Candidatus Margulisiibacteriota bacterium]HCY37716.1 hypothetical protein [Candidatus Margulisiibacteriota bacterium]
MKRVIIIEDNKSIPQGTSHVFQHLNVRADCAGSLEGVLACIQENIYAAAVIDIPIPGIDMAELNKTIREKQPAILIIATTSQDEVHSRDHFLSLGFDEILYKPFNFEQLMNYLYLKQVNDVPAG